MPESLQTPDGQMVAIPENVQEAQRDFAAAMAAPVEDIPSPPDRAEKPPADAAKPKRGRPPKSGRSKPSAGSAAPSTPLPPKDYTEDLNGLAQGAWLTLGAFPFTAAYAGLIPLNQPGLVNALNQGAQQNATLRGYIEKAASGGGGLWMIQLGVVAAGMGMQALQLARDPDLRAKMAAKTQSDIQAYLEANGLMPDSGKTQETDNAGSDVQA